MGTDKTEGGRNSNGEMKKLQITQNRLLRALSGVTLKDKKPIKEMLTQLNIPSVNKLATEIKLTEAWKSIHDPAYPIKLERNRKQEGEETRRLRPESVR